MARTPRQPAVASDEDRSKQGREKQRRRYDAILKFLQENGSITVEDLSEKLSVSLVTIRRDLDALQQKGFLSRTHGGAVVSHPQFYESFKTDRSFTAQVEQFAEEKRRIGRAAAALVQPGDTVAITPGTTTAEIIRGLPFNANLTLVTNTVNVAMELSKRQDIDVFVTGGHLRGNWFSLVGPTAVQSLGNMLIHILFIGADGLDAEWGSSCYHNEEAELNSALVRLARRRVAVVDHSKFGIVAKWRICGPEALHTIVTDTGATDEMIAPFLAAGIDVIRA